MTRLFLVDDHAILRQGLRLLLAGEPNVAVVGEASHGQHLLDQLPTTPADVVLLDMNMPVLDGLATARRLQADYPEVRVVMLSMIEEPLTIGEALAAGASGYLLKNADKDEILAAIRLVQSGRQFLSSEIGLALLGKLLTKSEPEPPTVAGPLTRREMEVLQLVAEGLTTQQIADQLFTSKRTVETHRQNILDKTNCKNTASLIHYAATNRMLGKD